MSQDELSAALYPCAPHPSGAVEIRTNVLVEAPNRPDAGVRYYVAVEP